jgi:hypothetical protein
MSIPTSISRFADYYRRHGFGATIRRIGLALERGLFSNRMVVFYCDLSTNAQPSIDLPGSLKINRLTSYPELNSEDLQQIIQVWNPKLSHRNIRERFSGGAALWLIMSGGNLAGYAWTLRGRTMVPYYLPLGQDDVHLFDFYVFRKYRGRAIIHFLVTYILKNLELDGAKRVFGEVAEWNQPSLSSYKTTSFRRLGRARMVSFCGRTLVSWDHNSLLQEEPTSRREKTELAPSCEGEGSKVPS